MSSKTVCDRCGKEGARMEPNLWWSVWQWKGVDIIEPSNFDFCSIECLFWWSADRMPSPFVRQEKPRE